jgi:hypothetical protein
VDGTRIAAQQAPIEVNILDIRYGDSERGLQAQLAGSILAGMASGSITSSAAPAARRRRWRR